MVGSLGNCQARLACQMLFDAATAFKHRGRKPFQHIIRRGGVLVVPDAALSQSVSDCSQKLRPPSSASNTSGTA